MIGRKIVQIAVTETQVFALCDDGTVWVSWMNAEAKSWSPWAPLPKIWQTLWETLGETTKD